MIKGVYFNVRDIFIVRKDKPSQVRTFVNVHLEVCVDLLRRPTEFKTLVLPHEKQGNGSAQTLTGALV